MILYVTQPFPGNCAPANNTEQSNFKIKIKCKYRIACKIAMQKHLFKSPYENGFRMLIYRLVVSRDQDLMGKTCALKMSIVELKYLEQKKYIQVLDVT